MSSLSLARSVAIIALSKYHCRLPDEIVYASFLCRLIISGLVGVCEKGVECDVSGDTSTITK